MTCTLEQEVKRGPGRPPKVDLQGHKELEKVESQINSQLEPIKNFGHINAHPNHNVEPQTKLSSTDIEKSNQIYLKPIHTVPPGVNPKTGVREAFNEKFRSSYEFDKQYVQFISEHKELLGENIEIWTKPYPGINAEEWKIPTNKPVWGPRYLAEQIKRKFYRKLTMKQDKIVGSDGHGSYYGAIEVESTVPRLDCFPVNNRKSIFMSAI